MVVEIIRKRVCDVPACGNLAEPMMLQRGGTKWSADLCSTHVDPVLTLLPWTVNSPSPSRQPRGRVNYSKYVRGLGPAGRSDGVDEGGGDGHADTTEIR